MKPYFYKIRHIKTGMYYVGSQYGKNANPNNLLVTYFTSSTLVETAGYNNFEIVYIKERADARSYEAKYLKKAYRILGETKFKSLLLNRNIAPGIINTPDSIEKANKKRKVSNRVAANKLLEEGKHNFQNNPNPSYKKENREMHSNRMKGNTLGALRKITPELKEKLAEASKGNTNVRGRIWVVNQQGIKKRALPNNIPEGYIKGTTWLNLN